MKFSVLVVVALLSLLEPVSTTFAYHLINTAPNLHIKLSLPLIN